MNFAIIPVNVLHNQNSYSTKLPQFSTAYKSAFDKLVMGL
jgi:hypothetical protein